MKLASDENYLATNKLLILYILNKIDKSITNDSLIQLVLSVTDLNYFYFQQFLLDLIESKYVLKYEKEKETLYKITKRGQEALELTGDILPGILKLKVDLNLKNELNTIEEALSVTAEYLPKSETDFMVKCKITENNSTIFEVKTFAGSSKQAKDIAENWKTNVATIYPKILELLNKKDKRDE